MQLPLQIRILPQSTNTGFLPILPVWTYVLLVFLLGGAVTASRAQNPAYLFAKALSSNGLSGIDYKEGRSIKTDASGNIYVTGSFYGTVDFDPSGAEANLTTDGLSNDIFLAKYDALGNYVWAKRIGANGSDQGFSLALDGSGTNVLLTGYFEGTVDFDPSGAEVNLISEGSSDIFLAKYDASGNYVWANRVGGSGDDQALSVAIDVSNNVLLTGYFSGAVDFDPSVSNVASLTSVEESSDIFLAKYTTSGNYVWAIHMGGENGGSQGNSVATDGSGNVLITGYFRGAVDFDPSISNTANLTAEEESTGIFLAKYDESGNYVWAIGMGESGRGSGESVAADGAGNVLVTGGFSGTVDFDPSEAEANLSSEGDIFLAKYSASGQYLWAKGLGGTDGDDVGYGVAADGAGNVLLTGLFTGTADFDPSEAEANLTAEGEDFDIFLAKYDPSGNYVWAISAGGTGIDYARSLALDTNGNIIVTGAFAATADFDPSAAVANLTATGPLDVFIAKYGNCQSIATQPVAGSALCVGGAVSVPISVTGTSLSYQWYKDGLIVSGQTSGTLTLSSLTLASAGSYSVEVMSTSGCPSVTSTAFSLTVNAVPTASLTRDGALAPGPTNVLLTGHGGTTYSFSGPGVISQDATLGTALVNVSGTYSVTVTSTNGCSSTASIALAGTDLTPILIMPQANFVAAGSVNNCLISIFEVAGLPTSLGEVSISITVPMGYTISFDNTLASINVSGGETNPVAVNNANWTVTSTIANRQILMTANAGQFIGAGDKALLGFSITRTSANSGSVSNITVAVKDDVSKAYDGNSANNVYARVINGL